MLRENQQKLREELQRQTDVPNELQELTEKQFADKTSHPSPQVEEIQYVATNKNGAATKPNTNSTTKKTHPNKRDSYDMRHLIDALEIDTSRISDNSNSTIGTTREDLEDTFKDSPEMLMKKIELLIRNCANTVLLVKPREEHRRFKESRENAYKRAKKAKEKLDIYIDIAGLVEEDDTVGEQMNALVVQMITLESELATIMGMLDEIAVKSLSTVCH